MADRPIIFSAPMVRALLAGRKAQTRRICKEPWGLQEWVAGEWRPIPRFAPGDRLWVRETWAVGPIYDGVAPRDINPAGKPGWCGIRYAASDDRLGIKDRSPIHMPRWASRLTLTVTEVRVQRLQEISEADAWKEGCDDEWAECCGHPDWKGYGEPECCGNPIRMSDPIGQYCALWNSIHGPDAWTENPWVAAISFTVERRNIDTPTEEPPHDRA